MKAFVKRNRMHRHIRKTIIKAIMMVTSLLGVAEQQLTEVIPNNLKGEVPSIEDLKDP